MFDDDEDDDDDALEEEEEESPFDTWYHDQLRYFSYQYKLDPDEFMMECELFYNTVCRRFWREVKEPLRELILWQYEAFDTDLHPRMREEIGKIASMADTETLPALLKLLVEDRIGVNHRTKIHDFEGLIDLCGSPRKPYILDRAFFDSIPNLTDEEREVHFQEHLQEAEEEVEEANCCRKEYLDIIQNSLLASCRQILNLSPDGIIMYAYILYKDYGQFQAEVGRLLDMLEYEFPIEYLDLPPDEFSNKSIEAHKEKLDRMQEEWEAEKKAEEEAKAKENSTPAETSSNE
jgi:hypothetical protein